MMKTKKVLIPGAVALIVVVAAVGVWRWCLFSAPDKAFWSFLYSSVSNFCPFSASIFERSEAISFAVRVIVLDSVARDFFAVSVDISVNILILPSYCVIKRHLHISRDAFASLPVIFSG